MKGSSIGGRILAEENQTLGGSNCNSDTFPTTRDTWICVKLKVICVKMLRGIVQNWLCSCVTSCLFLIRWQFSRYSDWLRDGGSGIESRWGRDFPHVQTGPGAHPASCKMGTGSSPGVKCGRGVLLTTHPLLVPRSWKSRAIPLPTLWATPGL